MDLREQARLKALQEMAARQKQFKQDIKDLDQSPIEIKDKKLSEGFAIPVGDPRNNDLGAKQKLQSGEAFRAKIEALTDKSKPIEEMDYLPKPNPVKEPSNTLDYKDLKKEYSTKRKQELAQKFAKAKDALPETTSVVSKLVDKMQETVRATGLDDHLRKLAKGSKAIGGIAAIPAALMAGRADQAMADVLIPGGLEGAGEGSDIPMQDDTPQVEMMSNYATDPNMRRMALQELRSRRR
jgi:hypothetical protein